MLEIIANNKALVLPKNLKVPFEDNSPIFGDNETILGTKTYPFSVPTKENMEQLGIQSVLNTYAPLYRVINNVIVKLNKKIWLKGTLRIRSVNSETTTLSFMSGISNLSASKNKKIADFITDEIPIPQLSPVYKMIVAQPDARMINGSEGGTMHMYFKVDGPYGAFTYTASVNGAGQYDAALLDLSTQINNDHAIHKIICFPYPWESGMLVQGSNNRDGLILYTDITAGDPYEDTYIFGNLVGLLDWRTYMSKNVRNGDDIANFVKSTILANNGEERIAFPTIYNPAFYGKDDQNLNPDFNGYINYCFYDGTNYQVPHNNNNFNTLYAGFIFNKYTFVPYPRLKYIIDSIFSSLGVKISGSFYNSPDFFLLVMDNNKALDEIETVYRRVFLVGSELLKFNVGKKVIKLKEHVWDMTLSEFLNELKNKFNIGFYYSKVSDSIEVITGEELLRSVDIENLTDVSPLYETEITEPSGFTLDAETDSSDETFTLVSVNNLSVLPKVLNESSLPVAEKNQAVLVAEDNIYRYSEVTETDPPSYIWKKLGTPLQGYTVGNGTKPITTKINTLHAGPIRGITDNPLKVPVKIQKGSSDEFGLGINPYSPRLLFTLGVNGQTSYSSNNGIVWFPHVNVYDTRTYFSLLYDDGERSLYNVFWRNWLAFLDTAKVVTWSKRFTVHELLNFKASSKKRIQSSNYIYSNLKLTVGVSKIEEGAIELYK